MTIFMYILHGKGNYTIILWIIKKKIQTNFSCSNNSIGNMKFIIHISINYQWPQFLFKTFGNEILCSSHNHTVLACFFFHVLIRYNKCENQNVSKRIFRLNSMNLKGLSLVIWDMWSYKVGETIKIQIVFIFILQTYISF